VSLRCESFQLKRERLKPVSVSSFQFSHTRTRQISNRTRSRRQARGGHRRCWLLVCLRVLLSEECVFFCFCFCFCFFVLDHMEMAEPATTSEMLLSREDALSMDEEVDGESGPIEQLQGAEKVCQCWLLSSALSLACDLSLSLSELFSLLTVMWCCSLSFSVLSLTLLSLFRSILSSYRNSSSCSNWLRSSPRNSPGQIQTSRNSSKAHSSTSHFSRYGVVVSCVVSQAVVSIRSSLVRSQRCFHSTSLSCTLSLGHFSVSRCLDLHTHALSLSLSLSLSLTFTLTPPLPRIHTHRR
jgi:hypothetical protein